MLRQQRMGGAIALLSIITIGLGSCAPVAENSATDVDTDESLQIVTTIVPMTQFTQAVAGDRAEVVQLLPSNVGPHDYQSKPTDVQAIAEADVLVQNGLELEFFLTNLIENAENEDLVIIDSSDGIETLASPIAHDEHGHDEHKEGEANDEHEHDEHEHDEHGHDEGEAHDEHGHDEGEAHDEHEHDEHGHDEHEEGEGNDERGHDEHEEHGHDEQKEGDAHHHHAHGEFDPHIWLDPQRAIEQVENIRDGLIAADPEGEAEYTANAAAFIEQLEKLDQETRDRLEPYAGQTFITFHSFALYFAERYDLEVAFLVDVPEENPTPEDVQRIIETTKGEDLKALLTEPQGKNTFDALAKDLAVEVSVFDPMETGDAAITEPESYIEIMQQNVKSLELAFSGSEQSFLQSPTFTALAAQFSVWLERMS
ncbi:MAG: zinc ABC transporter substrate-binding protein [Cyanobacteria bacterium P01_G01_bin.54]